jgi:hypothetical protein
MLLLKNIVSLIACVCILEGCHAQTKKASLEKNKKENVNIAKRCDNKINFIKNNSIAFYIGLTQDPPKIENGKIYAGGWKYHVRVENLSNSEIERYKSFSLETWLKLLNDENTDWAANLILYDIYDRNAFMLAQNNNKNTWRKFMKQDDIKYWKQSLKKR